MLNKHLKSYVNKGVLLKNSCKTGIQKTSIRGPLFRINNYYCYSLFHNRIDMSFTKHNLDDHTLVQMELHSEDIPTHICNLHAQD